MTVRWYYSVDASTVLEITDRIRLPVGEDGESIGVGSHADAGSGWEGDIYIDDPGGTLARPLGFRRIYAVQDAAPAGAQVVGNWFISGVKVRRMDPFSGTARRYVVTMADENSLLSRRKWTGADADRPEETDIVRIRWALLETELNVLSPDETYIDTTGAITLPAADLRDSSPEDMMMSIFQRTGKHYWVKSEEAAAVGGSIVSSSVAAASVITTTSAHGLTTGQTVVIAGHTGSTPSINGTHVVTVTGATTYTIPVNVTVGGTGGTSTTVGRYVLWYANMNTSSLYVSTISLSNDPADGLISADNPTSLVYPLSDDAELDGTVTRLSSGMIVPWTGGREYVQDTAVGDQYVYVDRVSSPPVPITTAAAALAQATRELAELAEPDDEVTTTLTVEAARLNLLMHGMIVPVHGTHFPNYTEDSPDPGWETGFVNCRAMSRVIRQVGPTTFPIDVRLSPITPATAYMLGFLVQRSGTTYGADIVPRGTDDGETSYADTWTYLAGGYIGQDGAGDYPFDVAYLPVGTEHNEYVWGGVAGLNGSSRPTGHSLIITGACGPPVSLQTLSHQEVAIAPSGTAPADGIMFILLGGWYGGDPSGSAFTLVSPATTLLAHVMASANPLDTGFMPRQWFGYRAVTSGEIVTWSFSETPAMAWGSQIVFVPGGADLAIVEYVLTGTAGSTISVSYTTAFSSINPGSCA